MDSGFGIANGLGHGLDMHGIGIGHGIGNAIGKKIDLLGMFVLRRSTLFEWLLFSFVYCFV
jgi:hypothetical protein